MTGAEDEPLPDIDFVEVDREAHQLGSWLGNRAHLSALHKAGQAEANGDAAAARFWRAVHATLRPR